MSACPPYTAGQPPNMAAQGHALANAYMAQQQQIAAAIAMGVMPFPPEAMAAAGAALQQNPTIGAAGTASAPDHNPAACIMRSDLGRPFLSRQMKQRRCTCQVLSAQRRACRWPRSPGQTGSSSSFSSGPSRLSRSPAALTTASPASPPASSRSRHTQTRSSSSLAVSLPTSATWDTATSGPTPLPRALATEP